MVNLEFVAPSAYFSWTFYSSSSLVASSRHFVYDMFIRRSLAASYPWRGDCEIGVNMRWSWWGGSGNVTWSMAKPLFSIADHHWVVSHRGTECATTTRSSFCQREIGLLLTSVGSTVSYARVACGRGHNIFMYIWLNINDCMYPQLTSVVLFQVWLSHLVSQRYWSVYFKHNNVYYNWCWVI